MQLIAVDEWRFCSGLCEVTYVDDVQDGLGSMHRVQGQCRQADDEPIGVGTSGVPKLGLGTVDGE